MPRHPSDISGARLAFAGLLFGASVTLATLPPLPAHAQAREAGAGRPDIAAGEFVVAREGHFYVGDRRLRLWGYNIQSGPFRDYAAIERVANRLAELGVNGVRLWPSPGVFYNDASLRTLTFYSARRGDGSLQDRYDFMVAELKRRGIFIHNTALLYADRTFFANAPDPEVRAIVAGDSNRFRELHGVALYLSPAYESVFLTHVRNYLSHLNPYTGKRYAEEEVFSAWELANETPFLRCVTNAACIDRLPPLLRERLGELWVLWQSRAQGVAANEPSLPPLEASWNQVENLRKSSYRRFVAERFIEVSRRLEAAARAMAPPGRGVRVQPFAFNTHSGTPSLLAHYAHGGGDFVAVGSYTNPISARAQAPFHPWEPYVRRGPIFHNFNFAKIEGKPVVVYENSFFRPYPYRVEWAPAILSVAALQDWDAVYFYMYGHPAIIHAGDGRDDDYGAKPLPEPSDVTVGTPRDYTLGFHSGGDAVAVGAWSAAGCAFLSGALPPAPRTARFVFGARSLFGPAPGYCLGAEGCGRGAPSMVTLMNELSLVARVSMAIDPGIAESRAEICQGCDAASRQQLLQPDPAVTWDREQSLVRFDAPSFKGAAGLLSGKIRFEGDIALEISPPRFGFVAVCAPTGESLASAKRISVFVQGTSRNTGFTLDASRIRFGNPLGAIAAVSSPGRAPVVFERPAVRLTLPGLRARADRFDFRFERYASDPVRETLQITAEEPLFRLDIVRD